MSAAIRHDARFRFLVATRFQHGITMQAIAAGLSVGLATVQRCLDDQSIKRKNGGHNAKTERNRVIRLMHHDGGSVAYIASFYRLSKQRVRQIIRAPIPLSPRPSEGSSPISATAMGQVL